MWDVFFCLFLDCDRVRQENCVWSFPILDMSTSYYLDTSVASLILDGELWSPRYEPQLSLTCSSLEEMALHPCVTRIKLAYKWSQEFKLDGGRLLITPSVKLELLSAPQVSF